ncbi:MAG: hypothetical protein OWU84_14745 [Firmicutes bacterium]|nr:hypothetical protein [Bacillota bacterium]
MAREPARIVILAVVVAGRIAVVFLAGASAANCSSAGLTEEMVGKPRPAVILSLPQNFPDTVTTAANLGCVGAT